MATDRVPFAALDLAALNAQLDPLNYYVMRRDDGILTLYQIERGAGYGGYDALREIHSMVNVPMAVISLIRDAAFQSEGL